MNKLMLQRGNVWMLQKVDLDYVFYFLSCSIANQISMGAKLDDDDDDKFDVQSIKPISKILLSPIQNSSSQIFSVICPGTHQPLTLLYSVLPNSVRFQNQQLSI